MGTVSDLKPSLKEIAALMCEVAAEGVWKRGRRDFMVIKKNLFGITVEVRQKGFVTAAVTPNWRVVVHTSGPRDTSDAYSGGNVYRLPVAGWLPRSKPNVKETIVRKEPVFEIQSIEQFERDWTLIRLFSSEWADGI